jgi:NAD+ synthase (glutamine-hydrolysing)
VTPSLPPCCDRVSSSTSRREVGAHPPPSLPGRCAVTLRLALGQLDVAVGDIDGNVERILDVWRRAAEAGADLVVFTELTITGYPPEDLLLKPEFVRANLEALHRLAEEGPTGTVAVVGYVGTTEREGDDEAGHAPDGAEATPAGGDWDVALAVRDLTNSAAVLADGDLIATYDKKRLPNYGVFDEARYFVSHDRPCVVDIGGVPVGVTVCEDLWSDPGPLHDAAEAGAAVVLSLNASPYHHGKRTERERWVRHHATRDGTYVAYCNAVGGHDEVVFDGDSMICAPDGEVLARGAQFEPDLVVVDLDVEPTPRTPNAPQLPGNGADKPRLPDRHEPARLDRVAEVWRALVLATRDYCQRNGFERAIIGLSGGIDSAVVAAVAAEALGGEQLIGVAMPSPYSSQHSLDDAEALARNLGCTYHVLPIGGPMTAVGEVLEGLVATGFGEDARRPDGREPGVAYENVQARLRGLLVMALSNEHGAIVLTTGNKSEYAVGYATLYGDMAGGFAPLKDVPKLLVYELARYANRDGEVIPISTIEKPPSAELRPDQRDEDSLPPYEVLDDIVEAYVLDDLGVDGIVRRGHDEATVRRVLRLIDGAEYKRRQSAPGPKITQRAFGRDRRFPITNGWRG